MEREETDLYGLPLDEFIPARTELEKRLRKEGERERAAAVKKLPKPSVAAWGVNQASRSQPQARRDLLDASAELRDVQERLIAGDASAADLETATGRQRTAIDALIDAAAGLLTGDGKSLGDATLARIRETLAAVASDAELAELVEAGTVDRERRPSGLGFPFMAGVAAEPASAPPAAKPKPKPGRGSAQAPAARSRGSASPSAAERKQREKEAKRRERELKAAREAVKAARAEEKEAARRRKAAAREAKQAGKELERTERAAEKARAAAEAADAELDAATAAAGEAERARSAAEAALDSLG